MNFITLKSYTFVFKTLWNSSVLRRGEPWNKENGIEDELVSRLPTVGTGGASVGTQRCSWSVLPWCQPLTCSSPTIQAVLSVQLSLLTYLNRPLSNHWVLLQVKHSRGTSLSRWVPGTGIGIDWEVSVQQRSYCCFRLGSQVIHRNLPVCFSVQ